MGIQMDIQNNIKKHGKTPPISAKNTLNLVKNSVLPPPIIT